MTRNLRSRALLYTLIGMGLNLAGSFLAASLNMKLYLDSVGTIFTAVLCGYFPGIFVGLMTNLIKCLWDSTSVYFAIVNVLIAVIAAFFGRRGCFRKASGVISFVLVLTAAGGVLGYLITWFIYDRTDGIFLIESVKGTFAPGLADAVLWDLADKTLSVLIVFCLLAFLKMLTGRPVSGLYPLHERRRHVLHSLRTKTLSLLFAALLLSSAVQMVISVTLFTSSFVEDRKNLAVVVGSLIRDVIPADEIGTFAAEGRSAAGYEDVENRLYQIRSRYPDIKYVYVYQIREDGCHAVFDLETDDTEAAEPGEVIPFDASFAPYIEDLLAGEEMEPVITNDTYGYLLTAYTPVRDSSGQCVCYVGVDILMNRFRGMAFVYLIKTFVVFLGFSVFILALASLILERHIIRPVLSIASAAKNFVMTDSEERHRGQEELLNLEIHTNDEIEELYTSVTKMTSESVQYISQIQNQQEMLRQMQNGLITVLAEVVESRDTCTGMHVKKTADYVRLIVEAMREDDRFKDQVTDEFVENIETSAPLHDVGKIKIPDAILNKPGRLTDEEFAIMKEHTTEGNAIIDKAIHLVPDPMFLGETQNMTAYHHEKWDGSGYPCGLKGEEIPLSARIMAVADVFDALVSERSYKAPMPYDEAFDIIRKGSGTHFDPAVVELFLAHRDEAVEIARQKGGAQVKACSAEDECDTI